MNVIGFMDNAKATNVTVKGASNPCPNCDGTGHAIVDGIPFDVLDGQISVPAGSLSANDLAIAITMLSPFQSGEQSKKATQQAIVKVLPDLASEINELTQSQLAILITVILAILAMVQNQLNSDGATVQAENIIQLVREQTNLLKQQSEIAEQQWDESIRLDRERNELLKQQSQILKEHLETTPEEHKSSHPQHEPGGK